MTSSKTLVLPLRNKCHQFHGSRKPFPSDIDHFRNQAAVEGSVKNHKLFEGVTPEL